MLEPDMRTYLAGAGTGADDVYLKTAPQNANYPYIVVFKNSPGRQYTHDGYFLSSSNMQCSCYAGSYRAAKILAGQVITAMEAWSDVQAVFLVSEIDLFEERTYHVSLSFLIWHDL